MIKSHASRPETLICNECGEEIISCSKCAIEFGAEDVVYCDNENSHYCNLCGRKANSK